jgi:hypothetical protein
MTVNTTLLLEILIPLMLTVTFGAMRALFRSQNSRFEDFAKGVEKLDKRIFDLNRRFDELNGRFERHLDNHK